MGFLENWFGDKKRSRQQPFAGASRPAPKPLVDEIGANAHDDEIAAALRAHAATATPPPAFERRIHDYTAQPSIDPALLQKILPRDGECAFTVSGLDGVLTVGRDMVMSTDRPIHCQTVRVLGTLEATIIAQRLIVAEGALVSGNVRVNDAEISGEFDGSLQARGTVSFSKTATVFGKVRALELAISTGALVHGADIKRVVPSVFDDLNPEPINEGRFDDGYASMCVTVSQTARTRAMASSSTRPRPTPPKTARESQLG